MIDVKEVKELLEQTGDQTLSVYLDVSEANIENQAVAPQWSVWLKNTLRDLGSGLNKTNAEAWPGIRDWAENYFSQYSSGRKPQTRGIVLFASPSFQQVYELPLPFDNRASFGKPHVAPLLWAIDEYEPYLVAMVDKEKARFFTSYLASVDFQDSLEIDLDEYDFGTKPMRNTGIGGNEGGGGTNKEAWQRLINEHERRFYKQIAETAVKLADKQKADRIIIAGSEDSLHEVYNLLSEHDQARVAGMVAIPMYSTTAEIFQLILPVAQKFERDQEMKLVGEVIDFAKSGGRGALGREAVDNALTMQRVETLILPWPVDSASMNEYMERIAFQALQLNSKVELVHEEAADLLATEGNVAARLYYAMETPQPKKKK